MRLVINNKTINYSDISENNNNKRNNDILSDKNLNSLIEVTDSPPGFFEGAEKKLHIDISPSLNLLEISEYGWQSLLKYASCIILSSIQTDEMKAFVLSESSLLVWRNHFLLKTCGKTNLIFFLENFLNTDISSFGNIFINNNNDSQINDGTTRRKKLLFGDFVKRVKFSRPFYRREDLQLEVHRGFRNEVSMLKKVIKNFYENMTSKDEYRNKSVKERIIKSKDFDKRCKIYNLESKWFSFEFTNFPSFVFGSDNNNYNNNDEKKKIVETSFYNLTKGFSSIYFDTKNFEVIENQLNLKKIFPSFKIDYFLFKPCGFSCNGIKGKEYFTIHVTPEDEFSYFSLETNMNFGDEMKFINDIFRIVEAKVKVGVVIDGGVVEGIIKNNNHKKKF